MASDDRQRPQRLNTGGGAYVGGNVDTAGGDFVGKDSVKSVVHGSVERLSVGAAGAGAAEGSDDLSVAGFQQALADFVDQLQHAELSPGLKQSVIEDVETVTSQTQEDEPDTDLIIHKVDSIGQLLGRMAGTVTSLTGLTEGARQLIDWAAQLFR
ncbi:hypothetical protein [Streptomyces sp. NBC_00083]|uniref:hypothetical protein n=1 Tax=Streptomyces sp. NBC_00083 TaxID=2975647 RepID=UPI002250DA12|nr:hypothetical protein [Streptomyces sp. NBC_00083]MCX5386870.1 hypothetical protein [Streptomyces sp. NBC_00083]